jgi:uncharacterized membrane protein YhaH (DUF805 family)
MNWYLEVLTKYAVFSGRARRKEFWYFFLVNIIASILLMVIDAFTGSFNANVGMGLLGGIYTLAVLIPGIAVSVRRLHDTGRKGWWLLICLVPLIGTIVLLVFTVQDSDPGENRFGSNPKKGDHADSKGLDEDAYMERILREADARARGEARRRATYPISEEAQKDEEFLALLKSTVKENRLDIIPNEELFKICNRARSIAAFGNTLDIELSKAIDTLSEEIKKRGLSQENMPRVISNYGDSSFTKKNKTGGMSKWVYAIPVIVIALVVSISYFSDKDETGRKATKAPTFDILRYQNDYKDYYGDASLEDIARDFYNRTAAKDQPDYNAWKKDAGIEPIIQEDTKRRTPSPPSILDKLKYAPIPFRYDEESIQGRLYRYDRFTMTVQQKSGAEWVSIPWLKSLQHARDVLAKRAIDRQNEELKDTLETMKREQQFKDMNREFDEQQREMDQQFRETNRQNESPTDMLTKFETEEQNRKLNRNIEDLKDTVETMKREQESRDIQRRFR